MKRPERRIIVGAMGLSTIVIIAVLGYHLAGWGWIDSIYMVVITISTIGYREAGPMTPGLEVFNIFVILAGIFASAYTFGGFIQFLTAGEIDRILGDRRMNRDLQSLTNHVIICGFGRTGRIMSEELRRQKVQLVVIDRDPVKSAEAQALGFLSMSGDAGEEGMLETVRVRQARVLATALPDDAANVFITLTARNLNPHIQIIARGEQLSTQKKLVQAGADRVVLPAVIGGLRMAAMVTHPSTVEFFELAIGSSNLDVEMDELTVPPASALVSRTVVDCETRQRHGLLVVAAKKATGPMVFNPDKEYIISAGDTLIVMGSPANIGRFREEFGI